MSSLLSALAAKAVLDGTEEIYLNDGGVDKRAVISAIITLAQLGVLQKPTAWDASGNPNYPSAAAGYTRIVTVAGKVGGASGKSVAIGDWVICQAANGGGTEASVGTSWFVVEGNVAFTVVGLALAMLANPGAIAFIRINADNTVTALSAADYRTALALGTAALAATGDFDAAGAAAAAQSAAISAAASDATNKANSAQSAAISAAASDATSKANAAAAASDPAGSAAAVAAGLNSVTNDAQLKRAAGDFASFSEKTVLVGADKLLLENSEAGGAKEFVKVENLPGGAPANGSVSIAKFSGGIVTADAGLGMAGLEISSTDLAIKVNGLTVAATGLSGETLDDDETSLVYSLGGVQMAGLQSDGLPAGAWLIAVVVTTVGNVSAITDHRAWAHEPTNTDDFATAAQGAKADSAVQPGDLGTAAAAATTDFATATQGGKADSALQPAGDGSALTGVAKPADIPVILSGSASLDFGSTAPLAASDLTITVTGAVQGDPVALGVPYDTGQTNNAVFTAWVSASNVVTIRFYNIDAVSASDPFSGEFKVKVFK